MIDIKNGKGDGMSYGKLSEQRRKEIEREVQEDLSQVDLLKELNTIIYFLRAKPEDMKVSELLSELERGKEMPQGK